MKIISIDLINASIDFIEANNLGLTDFFCASEKLKNYSDIEKNRLKYLLNICNDLIKEKITVDDLRLIIKDKLQISDTLSGDISEKFKKIVSEKKQKEDTDLINQDVNKKSIFSSMIKDK